MADYSFGNIDEENPELKKLKAEIVSLDSLLNCAMLIFQSA
jgi:hypothetical protein